jgi:hypothetical protein
MDSPQAVTLGAASVREQVAAVHERKKDVKSDVTKKQPWKDFFAPGVAATKPAFQLVGDGAIRLTAELDDKDLGG